MPVRKRADHRPALGSRPGETPPGTSIDALYQRDGKGGDIRVDSGSLGTITQLRVRGRVISWLHGGARRTATLVGTAG